LCCRRPMHDPVHVRRVYTVQRTILTLFVILPDIEAIKMILPPFLYLLICCPAA